MATIEDSLDLNDPAVASRLYISPQYGSSPQSFSPGGSATLADTALYSDPYSSGKTPGSPQSAQNQQASILSTLPQNLADAYSKTLEGMMSGSAYAPQRTQNNAGFVRAANELRARSAAGSVGAAGQGSAIASRNAVENTILSAASENDLNNRIQEEALKQQGLSAANTLMGMEESRREFGITTGLEQQKINEAARQFNISDAHDMQKFSDTLKYDYAALSQADKQFLLSYGLDEAKFNEAKSQFSQTFAETQRVNTANIEHAKAALASNEMLTRLGIASSEKIAGMNISSDEKIAGMQITSAEKLATWANALQQQGIDLNKAALEGFTDPSTGQYVPGSIQIAAQRFGLESDTLDLQREEIKRKYGLLDAADKRAADEFYGFDTTDSSGNSIHHLGSAELAENAQDIQRDGLSIEEAKLKGYDKADGTHVDGNLETAAKSLGLQGETVQLQRDEIYGYYDKNGQYVPGKLASMSEEQQMRAKELFGYTDPSTGQKVPGSMELSQRTVNANIENARASLDNEIRQTNSNIDIAGRSMKIQEATAASAQYWNTADKVSAYAQTHIDLNSNDPTWRSMMKDWYTQQYGYPPSNTAMFERFCKNELSAAQDGRLTNAIDQAMYTINSSTSLSDTEKAQFSAFLKAMPEGTTFSTDAEGNLVPNTGVNNWIGEGGLEFDTTNTYTSKPAMFAEGGGVWVGEGQQQFLTDGQKITLGTNFGVQNANTTIPKGNYTAVFVFEKALQTNRTLLQSEDGSKFYLTSNKITGSNGVVETGTPVLDGYTYHKDGGYYTKNS